MEFRHRLETHNLAKEMLVEVNVMPMEQSHLMTQATLVDAILIAAPSSTRNKEQAHHPQMHQAKRSNPLHLVLNAHIGVDKDSALAHIPTTTTPANNGDISQTPALLHEPENDDWADTVQVDAQLAPSNLYVVWGELRRYRERPRVKDQDKPRKERQRSVIYCSLPCRATKATEFGDFFHFKIIGSLTHQAIETAIKASRKIKTAPARGSTSGMEDTTASTASISGTSRWGIGSDMVIPWYSNWQQNEFYPCGHNLTPCLVEYPAAGPKVSPQQTDRSTYRNVNGSMNHEVFRR